MRSPPSDIRLSIALVTRNRPVWLRQCLESWRSQSVQPFEIVVSDDSDAELAPESEQLAAQYGYRYVKGPRRGLYANRNHAALSCRGTHIMSADDDHTHPQGFLHTIMGEIQTDSDAVWTVSERNPKHPHVPHAMPGELRSNGTVGPPEDLDHSAAIACGSTVYPRQVFDMGLRCDETYRFGGLWYLWGHQLSKANFRIRYCPDTFVWHNTASAVSRIDDLASMKDQLECNLYVQAVHALRISHKPAAVLRMMLCTMRLLTIGVRIHGQERKARLRAASVVLAFCNALRKGCLFQGGDT